MEKLFFFDETFYWGRSGKRATVIEAECELTQSVRPEELRAAVLSALRVHRNFRARPVIVGRRFFVETSEVEQVTVVSENDQPRNLIKDTACLMLYVTYGESRFTLHVFHGLGDMRSICAFLHTVLSFYCGIDDNVLPAADSINTFPCHEHILEGGAPGEPEGKYIPQEHDIFHLPEKLFGSTFKGAIDDMPTLNAVLRRHPELPAVYRHVDAALFGGYLPFTEHRQLVSSKKMGFESIAVSGHKFFGIDSPCGLFICTREVYDNQSDFDVPYLNKNMRMINCSRDPIQPLKFWWVVQKVGAEGWTRQARRIMELTVYLKQQLDKAGYPSWVNEYSNTVFLRCPSPELAHKYQLAQNEDARFGGKLAHVVVMQHFTEEAIDAFVAALGFLAPLR